jgi:hypothetical protein
MKQLEYIQNAWESWQLAILRLLQADFAEILPRLTLEDFDWPSWQTFFVEGRTPLQAIESAFGRDA